VFTADRAVIRYIGAVEDITDRKTAEQTLRRLSARIESTREEERTRVARELHDELGQTLTSLRLDVARLTQHLASSEPPLEVVNRLQSLVGQVELSIETVRRIAQGLRPATLNHHDLATAIRSETLAFQARTGIRCRFTSRVAVDRSDVVRATAIFRILQEALTNVARHAQAGAVTVRLWEKARCVWLDVRDNGRGMTDAELSNEHAVGLVGMRERAAGLGGEVRILSAPGKGTRVTVRIPAGPAAPRT
jgi:signal transduction histidine kinase